MAELSTYAYYFPLESWPNLDEDAPGDFYLFCHAKLVAMIDSFEDRGIPFEHYVNSVLRWQLHSFLRARQKDTRDWQVALFSDVWSSAKVARGRGLHQDDSTLSRPPAPVPHAWPRTRALRLADPPAMTVNARAKRRPRLSRTRRFRLPKMVNQRRMLFALMKTAHLLDDRQFAILAAAAGCHPDSLLGVLRRVDRQMEATRRRLQVLRERRNQAFAEYHFWTTAAYLETDAGKYAYAQRRAARHRCTLTAARAELARVRVAPSNRVIATVLGVPKGTVDTGLSTLRRARRARYF
jgi:hypothetical protein